jgi:hypothetical protein
MGFITDIKETGKTIYEVNLVTLKKMVAVDLGINEEAITVTAMMANAGGYDAGTDVFNGLKITVDHSKVKPKDGLQYPAGVRASTSCGPRGYDESLSNAARATVALSNADGKGSYQETWGNVVDNGPRCP